MNSSQGERKETKHPSVAHAETAYSFFPYSIIRARVLHHTHSSLSLSLFIFSSFLTPEHLHKTRTLTSRTIGDKTKVEGERILGANLIYNKNFLLFDISSIIFISRRDEQFSLKLEPLFCSGYQELGISLISLTEVLCQKENCSTLDPFHTWHTLDMGKGERKRRPTNDELLIVSSQSRPVDLHA